MKPRWFEKITIDSLPDNLREVTLEMVEAIRPMLRKDQRGMAEKIALECMKVELVAFEGTEPYWPQFDGDKFIETRYAAIRADFRKRKASESFRLRDFLDRWGLSERRMRSIINQDHEKQMEAFPDMD